MMLYFMFPILCGVCAWIYVSRYRMRHLTGFWYLQKKDDRIGQWIDPIINAPDFLQLRKRKGKKPRPMRGILRAFDKLETGCTYKLGTHFISELERYQAKGYLEILSWKATKKRYLHELIPFWGVAEYLRQRLAHGSKENPEIYKQFCSFPGKVWLIFSNSLQNKVVDTAGGIYAHHKFR